MTHSSNFWVSPSPTSSASSMNPHVPTTTINSASRTTQLWPASQRVRLCAYLITRGEGMRGWQEREGAKRLPSYSDDAGARCGRGADGLLPLDESRCHSEGSGSDPRNLGGSLRPSSVRSLPLPSG